jgi:hypothetical protein
MKKTTVVLYMNPEKEEKSLELKSGLEILKVKHEIEHTHKMPCLKIDGEILSFSQSKALIFEHLNKNRRFRRYLKKNKISIIERKIIIWQRFKRMCKRILQFMFERNK